MVRLCKDMHCSIHVYEQSARVCVCVCVRVYAYTCRVQGVAKNHTQLFEIIYTKTIKYKNNLLIANKIVGFEV